MGKKAKSTSGIQKAQDRKIDKSQLPPPPPPPEDEMGSAKPLEKPSLPGKGFQVLGEESYDDGGVADLSLLIDLDDSVQRRKRGENEYFTALRADLLPRATKGPMAKLTRREQKVSLAQLLFSEEEDCEDRGPSEVYVDQVDGEEDKATVKNRAERLAMARAALRLSLLLREPAGASLSLSELCKRKLTYSGKKGAENALKTAELAMQIAGDGFWDGDEVAIEAEDHPLHKPNFERNATTPGLANPTSLKLLPMRASDLCMRSALLQRGNALAALGREEEARKSYEGIIPLLENEPRCARVDWERLSLFVNIGNTHSRCGDYALADEQYKIAEQLGKDHLQLKGGSEKDGIGMLTCVKRARSFALKRAGREEEAKVILKEVLDHHIKENLEAEEKRKKKKMDDKEKEESEAPTQTDENALVVD